MSPKQPWESSVLMSRATFLRRSAAVSLSVPMLGLLAACGDDSSETTSAASGGGEPTDISGTLRFLGWQGYDNKAAARPITKQGVDISAQYVTSNDDFVTKLRGGTSLDVITPFIPFVPGLVMGDLLQELDYDRIPSSKDYFPELVDLVKQYGDGKTYGAPIVWGDIPMIVRPELMPDLPESWLDLRDPKYKGQLVTLDDAYQNLITISRAVNGPENAGTMTHEQLADVVQVWKEIKPNLVAFAPSFGDEADILARGDAAGSIVGWRFMQQQMAEQNVESEAHVPEEGTFAWLDVYSIPTDAPNPDAAYAFIDVMTAATGNALVAAGTGSAVSNEGARAKLPPDQKDLYPYDEMASYFANQYPLPLDPEEGIASYDDWLAAWEEIKSA